MYRVRREVGRMGCYVGRVSCTAKSKIQICKLASWTSVTKRRPHHTLGVIDPRRPHSAVICQYSALVIFSYPPDVTSHSTHFPPHTIHTRRLLWRFTNPLLLLRRSAADAIYTICTKVQNNNLKKSFFVWIINRYPKTL